MIETITQYTQEITSINNPNMWQWAFEHPYLYTIIKLGTPSLYAVLLYIGFRIITNVFSNGRKRY